jgi:hypothetical protein
MPFSFLLKLTELFRGLIYVSTTPQGVSVVKCACCLSLLLRKLPQEVNSRSTAFIDQVMLLELQNSPFWNLSHYLHVASPLAAEFFR